MSCSLLVISLVLFCCKSEWESLTSGITLLASSDAWVCKPSVPGMSGGNSVRRGWNGNAIYSVLCLLLCTFLQSPKQWVLFLWGERTNKYSWEFKSRGEVEKMTGLIWEACEEAFFISFKRSWRPFSQGKDNSESWPSHWVHWPMRKRSPSALKKVTGQEWRSWRAVNVGSKPSLTLFPYSPVTFGFSWLLTRSHQRGVSPFISDSLVYIHGTFLLEKNLVCFIIGKPTFMQALLPLTAQFPEWVSTENIYILIQGESCVRFYWGQSKGCSPGDSISDSSEKLLQRALWKVKYICDFREGEIREIDYIFFAEGFC